MKKTSPEIQKELISILFQNLLLGFAGISLVSLIIVWQLRSQVNTNALLLWFVLLNLNLLVGVGVTYWYQQTANQPALQNYHFWAYIIGSNVTALLFGILGSLLMPSSLATQLFVIIIVLSIAGASVQNLHASYLASGSYLCFILIPLVIWEIIQAINGHPLYIAILAATLIFMMYLIIDVYSGYAMLENNIKLKIDNIAFAKTVSYQKNLMEFLSNMLSRFQRSGNEQEIYNIFYENMRQIFPQSDVFLYTCHNDANQFTLAISAGMENINQKTRFGSEECFAATSHIPYLGSYGKYCRHFIEHRKYSICVPLLASDETIGIICSLLDRPLSSVEENFMYRLAAGLALGISNLRLRERLNQALIHDALTKLYNRYYLDTIVDKLIKNANNNKSQLMFVLLDVDYFKNINDTYGHNIGDIVLINFSKKLKEFFSNHELVFRYGGEEFLVILENMSLSQAISVADEFREYIKTVLLLTPKYSYKLSISGGISVYPLNGKNFTELINAADNALYMAKKIGRDKIVSASSVTKEA